VLPIQMSKWGGAALIVGSLLFIANKFDDMSRVYLNNWTSDLIDGQSWLLIAIGQVTLVAGLLVCYRLYAGRSSRAGRIGLLLLLAGGIFLGAGHVVFTPLTNVDALFILVLLGVFLMMVGLIVFGTTNLRRKALQRWQLLPLAPGVTGALGFFLFSGSQNEAIFLLLRSLFGVGLILLGVVMWQDQRGLATQEQLAAQPTG
jgi:hypothetical protein